MHTYIHTCMCIYTRGRNSGSPVVRGLPKMMTAVVRWTTTTFGNIFFKFCVCHVILLKSELYDYHKYLRTTRFPN